jgi:hypothetical protein
VLAECAGALAGYGSQSSRSQESVLENPVAFKNYSHAKDKYFQIERSVLVPGTLVPFSIYSIEQLSFRPVAEASESSPVRIDSHIVNAPGDLCIMTADVPRYNEYLRTLSDGKNLLLRSTRVKALVTKENAKVIMTNCWRIPERPGDQGNRESCQ